MIALSVTSRPSNAGLRPNSESKRSTFSANPGSEMSAAFAAMWRSIPLLRPLGLAALAPWLLAMFERLYVVFLRFRPRLQQIFSEGRRA